jgi:hypothetical protein
MPHPAERGIDNQIAAAAAEDTALIVAAGNIEFLDPSLDQTGIIVPSDGSPHERFDHDGQYVRQVPDGVLSGEDQPKEPKHETSFLGGVMRFTGAVVGFMMGGSAGAALGSVVGELAGDIAAEQSNIIWPRLVPSFLHPKRAPHEKEACDRGSRSHEAECRPLRIKSPS